MTQTQKVKYWAQELGFSFCGISKADFLPQEAARLEQWLKQNNQGEMGYMENHFDMRVDPRKLVPGAKSVVSLLFNYFPEDDSLSKGERKISKYAYGRDYHKVVKQRLKQLLQNIREEIGAVEGRAFVDSAPVMEKAWAAKSGLGWIGKNSNLINKQMGSFFFLAELIIDLDLEPDGPIKDYCGTCTKCIDACPTQAITPYQVDGSKCISYLTIELNEAIPSHFKEQMDGWAFGCDVCQDVCPWNRFSAVHTEPDFLPKPVLKDLVANNWAELTDEVFEQVFAGSAVKRTGLDGLKRNLKFLEG